MFIAKALDEPDKKESVESAKYYKNLFSFFFLYLLFLGGFSEIRIFRIGYGFFGRSGSGIGKKV